MKAGAIFAPVLVVLLLAVPAGAEEPVGLAELGALYRQQVAHAMPERAGTLAAIGQLRSPEAARFLAKLLADTEEAAERDLVVGALAATRQEQAFAALAALTEDSGSTVTLRGRAASELSMFDVPDPLPVLARLLDDPEAYVGSLAASGLVKRLRRSDLAVAARVKLQKVMLGEVARAATPARQAQAIAAVDDTRADLEAGGALTAAAWHKQLRALLKGDGDEVMLAACVKALARAADPADWKLMAGLCRHEDDQVRRAVLAVLAVYEKTPAELEPFYLEALADADVAVRADAFAALAGSDHPRALELARRALLEDAATTVRQAAGRLLAASPAPEAVDLLVRALAVAVVPVAEETPGAAREREAGAASLASSLATALERPGRDVSGFLALATEAKEPAVRIAAIRALALVRLPEAGAVLLAATAAKEAAVCLAAIAAVTKVGPPGACAKLAEVGRARRVKEIVLACVDGVGTHGKDDAAAAAYFLEAIGHPAFEVVMAAIDACGRAQVAAAVPALAERASHEAWQVRSAVFAAMKSIRVRECVEPLLARLREEEGKLLAEVILALGHITGKDIGTDPELWWSWWEVVRADFVVPPPEELAAGDLTRAAGTYYGIPVVSRRMTFILDISCSMSAAAAGRDGQASNRLAIAQAELTKVVAGLDQGVSFNVIFFDDQIVPWQSRLTPATPRAKADAMAAVQRQSPRGGTNIFDAVEAAFADEKVDTLYLLSDGQPGAGRFVAPDAIRREIARMNRLRRVTIHCIAIGAANDLLKELAADSSGIYVAR